MDFLNAFDVYDAATLVNIIIGLAYVGVTAVLVPGLSLPASTSRTFGLLLKALMVTFFLGCGLHHIHLAFHASFHGGGHSQITPEALVFNAMQAVAAPGAVAMAYYVRLATNRASAAVDERMDRLEVKQDRAEVKQDRDLDISEETQKGLERMENKLEENNVISSGKQDVAAGKQDVAAGKQQTDLDLSKRTQRGVDRLAKQGESSDEANHKLGDAGPTKEEEKP